jgi:hypothetical protein
MCKVEFQKCILSGVAEGLTITETMKFVDWNDACSWAGKVTESLKIPFVILELKNLETGEVQNF